MNVGPSAFLSCMVNWAPSLDRSKFVIFIKSSLGNERDMPNGLLFNLSRVFGLCAYSPFGKLDPWLMFWSVVTFSCWVSALIASKIALYAVKHGDKDRFLADSILNFQQALHAICVAYHLFVNIQERSKMEDVFAVASNIEPGAYEHSYVVFGSFLTIVIVVCSWYGSDEHHWWSAMDLGCYAVSVCTDFLLILQFCSVLKRLSVKFREVKHDIRTIRRVNYLGHSGLVAMAEDLNRIYDVQLLLICSKIFATIVHSAYSFYGQLETVRDSLPSLTSLALTIVLCILMVFWLSDVCEEINADADSFNMELFDVMRENEELCHNDAFYLYVVVRQTVQVTACGFFDVGYPLVTSVIAAATTYLVILIQFS